MSLPNGVSVSYGYDTAARLTDLVYKHGTTVLGTLHYDYDAWGRRSAMGGSLARTGIPQAVTGASYDAANQLVQWGGTTITYDANGNIKSDGARNYTWDARNQLAAIAGSGINASFRYDGLGRRIGKTVNGVSTGYLLDGHTPVQELAGTSPIANLLTGPGVDEYLQRTDATGTATVPADGVGSTIGVVDQAGPLATLYTYEPFGKMTASGAANGNRFGFTGREDDRTGLNYFRARYYNPTLQRFMSEDPLGFAAGDSNLYAYVGNDPLNWRDPSGMLAHMVTVKDLKAIDKSLEPGLWAATPEDPLVAQRRLKAAMD